MQWCTLRIVNRLITRKCARLLFMYYNFLPFTVYRWRLLYYLYLSHVQLARKLTVMTQQSNVQVLYSQSTIIRCNVDRNWWLFFQLYATFYFDIQLYYLCCRHLPATYCKCKYCKITVSNQYVVTLVRRATVICCPVSSSGCTPRRPTTPETLTEAQCGIVHSQPWARGGHTVSAVLVAESNGIVCSPPTVFHDPN